MFFLFMSYIFTSESVTSGHPDKICDQISDAILDSCLIQDPLSKVAIDTWVKDNSVGIIGELTTNAIVDLEAIGRKVINDIGYNSNELGFNGNTCKVHLAVGSQSTEINKAVVDTTNIGAGDQGIMFGYAGRQTAELMPLPITLAHKLATKLENIRRKNEKEKKYILRPDGKTQVSIEFDDQNKAIRIDSIVISTQHSPEISQTELRELLIQEVILPTISDLNLNNLYQKTTIYTNPSGSFIIGGPVADSGLTGRKIVVDGYGCWARVGGGAFSGKDATKVDRSGAYMARYIAKKLITQNFADECEVQISYAIGKSEPTSVSVFGHLNKSKEQVEKWIIDNFDLRPGFIIQKLELTKPIFSATSKYGHFGRKPTKNGEFSWEN
jgi:S-adenosylmethionine synthetase